jgi:cell fate regulator YaaT (PSP1 superfamily)
MDKLIQVQVGEYRPISFFHLNHVDCKRGDFVILEVERGSEFGKVVSEVERPFKGKSEKPKGKVLRVATEGDLRQIENNRMQAKDSLSICMRKITDRKLHMHIVKSEYTFDSSKIIFSFTAEGRVDFRNLVKDLARVFRVRIELKQIGVRDKAKVIGGYGVCGRELCCASYMRLFHPLSIKMAKGQGLPLNPSRISGVCGRIKCCMSYEFNVYKQFSRNLPAMGEKIATKDAKGKVVNVNILSREVDVEDSEGRVIKVKM